MKLFYLIPIISIFLYASCSDDDNPKQAIIIDSGQLNQTVYADVTQGKTDVSFTTAGAWTSSVDYQKTKATEDEQSNWVSISPDQGNEAGKYEISIILDINTTGEDRNATILIRCGAEEIAISIVQKGTKEDGTVPVIIPPVEELFNLCIQSYGQVCQAWLQIDNQYSSLTSRLSLTAASSFLSDFWLKSYECISHCNLLIEQLNNSNLSDFNKENYRSEAFANRATTYFYMKTLFGGVPLITDTEASVDLTPRIPAEDIVNFIYDDYFDAIETQSADSTRLLMLAIIHLQEGELNHTVDLSERYLTLFAFQVANGDGGITQQDNNTHVIIANLLLAEVSLLNGNINEATRRINAIYAFYGQAQLASPNIDDIRAAVRNEYSKLSNTGMAFLNAVRWNDTQSWGYRILLPIPQLALDRNSQLTQNPGW